LPVHHKEKTIVDLVGIFAHDVDDA
jgi:hypothetical protein